MFWDRRNTVENAAMSTSFAMNIVLSILNIYWYYFIIRLVMSSFGFEMSKEEKKFHQSQ